jgi:hypothetical protein
VNFVDELGLKVVSTGIQRCFQGIHGFIDVGNSEGLGYGFVPKTRSLWNIFAGPGKVDDNESVADANFCLPVRLDPCEYNIDRFKECVLQRIKQSIEKPPAYVALLGNCHNWMDDIINGCINTSRGK